MKNPTQIQIGDAVRLKTPMFNVSSPLYVKSNINEKYVRCEYFKGDEQQNTESQFLISDLEKIIYG